MPDEIKPALTAEEWADEPSQVLDGWIDLELGTVDVCLGGPASTGDAARDRHALAALLLHRQDFGFTWADVKALEAVYRRVIADPRPLGDDAAAVEQMHDLAARIAALLPPEG
jgi:hypothetical protein